MSIVWFLCDFLVECFQWPHRLTVRTQGSHPCNRGSIPREVTKSAQFRKLPPTGAVFSLAARSACQRFFRGEIRNWSSFMTTSFCRICRFDPKISSNSDFFANKSSSLAILQIETAVSIHCFIGSTHVETPSAVCSICSCKSFFSPSISARFTWYSSRSTSPSR